ELIKTGDIIQELHYGSYLQDCPLQPGYICEGSGQSSGLNQDKTAQKLLENITFYPFIIKLENILIFVGSLGKILYSNPNKVGCHYMASLFYKYKAKQSVFSQCIRDNLYTITIYQNSQIIAEYNDSLPNAIWQQTAYEIKFLHQTPIPNQYTYADWDNKIIMEYLFELYLNKAVSKPIEK
ncbi:4623_t:CDS:2, partial [Dentiscutata heterogama]